MSQRPRSRSRAQQGTQADALAVREARQRRKQLRRRRRAFRQHAVPVAIACVVLVVTLLPASISRLPYLYTHGTYQAWLSIAATLLVLFALAAQYRPKGKASLWKRWSGGRGAPVRAALLGGLSAALLAWCAIASAAWLTYLYAPHGYAAARIVIGIDEGRRKLDVRLDDGSRVHIGRRRLAEGGWQVGARVCLVGRTWWLGTVVDDVQRDAARCEATGRQGSPPLIP